MYNKKWITAYGRYIAKYITKKLHFSVYDAVGLNGLADPVQEGYLRDKKKFGKNQLELGKPQKRIINLRRFLALPDKLHLKNLKN